MALSHLVCKFENFFSTAKDAKERKGSILLPLRSLASFAVENVPFHLHTLRYSLDFFHTLLESFAASPVSRLTVEMLR